MSLPRVEVEWVDSEAEGGWHSLREARRKAEAPLFEMLSCGYLVAQDDESLTLALSFRETTEEFPAEVGEVLKIPRVAVVAVHPVRRG